MTCYDQVCFLYP